MKVASGKFAKIQHTQPGKGGAFMQVEMKISSMAAKPTPGSVHRIRWKKSASIPRISSISMLRAMRSCSWTRTRTSRSTSTVTCWATPQTFCRTAMDVVLELWDERPDIRSNCPNNRSTDRRSRRCGKGADGIVQLQTRRARQRRACNGAAAYSALAPASSSTSMTGNM